MCSFGRCYQCALRMIDWLFHCDNSKDSKEEELLWLKLRYNSNKKKSKKEAKQLLSLDKLQTRYFYFSNDSYILDQFNESNYINSNKISFTVEENIT